MEVNRLGTAGVDRIPSPDFYPQACRLIRAGDILVSTCVQRGQVDKTTEAPVSIATGASVLLGERMHLDKPKLKILFDRPGDRESHARTLIQEIESKDLKNTYEPKPRGVAHYAALMPERCEDCGQTYWTRVGAQWTSHIRCPGHPPTTGPAGF